MTVASQVARNLSECKISDDSGVLAGLQNWRSAWWMDLPRSLEELKILKTSVIGEVKRHKSPVYVKQNC